MNRFFSGRGFAAFLFDMDGTLIDSIAAANRVWTRWAVSRGLDPQKVIAIMHGVRVVETMRRLNVPGLDVELESRRLSQAEIDDVEGVVASEGVKPFLGTLPRDRWAVVTSAPLELARRRLRAAGLDDPPVLITAEDVTRGKPAPDCFLLAAAKLNVRAQDCLVWEDAPAGISAAEASGATVMVVSATHAHPMETQHPVIRDYQRLAVSREPQGLVLQAG